MDKLENINSAQLHSIHRLSEKNESLMLANAEYIRDKMSSQIKQRSLVMVDTSIFSSFFHTSDPILQEEQAVILDSALKKSIKISDLASGNFVVTKRGAFSNGTCIVLKQVFGIRNRNISVT